MRALHLPAGDLHLLAIGAHSDDLEIGCGATVMSLIEARPGLSLDWVVCAAAGAREEEARASFEKLTANAGRARFWARPFRDGYLPYGGGEVKDFFEELKASGLPPDLILTHARHDLHQDHRLVAELTWNTFRDHLILEYEIPKYDGDLGAPNVFVRVSRELGERKVAHLMEVFSSQRDRRWFTEDLFWSMLRLRGMECQSPTSYAEAFYAKKAVFDL